MLIEFKAKLVKLGVNKYALEKLGENRVRGFAGVIAISVISCPPQPINNEASLTWLL